MEAISNFFYWLFNDRTGVICLVLGGIVLFIIIAFILERKTKQMYFNHEKNRPMSGIIAVTRSKMIPVANSAVDVFCLFAINWGYMLVFNLYNQGISVIYTSSFSCFIPYCSRAMRSRVSRSVAKECAFWRYI